MLPKAGHQCAQRGDLEEDILGKTGSFFAEYYKRPGNYAENEPFYPGRRGIRAAKERF